jgi:PD-(D/E)XK nuclease superfamily
MATSDATREVIFNKLSELFPDRTVAPVAWQGGSFSGSLDGDSVTIPPAPRASSEQLRLAISIAASTSDKGYRAITAAENISSFSKLRTLYECPRKYELEMLQKSRPVAEEVFGSSFDDGAMPNLDFAFGHSVGAGIQTYVATLSLQAAILAACLSWRAPLEASKLDKRGKVVGKSLPHAIHAVELFAQFFHASELSSYQVFLLPSGKPAVEVGIGVDTEDGMFHLGHIDLVLQHKVSRRLAIFEGKTQGGAVVHEASHGNSYQALGYSVVLDAFSEQLGLPQSDYEVFYVAYSSSAREFTLLPLLKNLAQRAEWLQNILLDHAMIRKYRELNFFPKRGDSCVNKWGYQCYWYGQCGMRNDSLFPGASPKRISSLEDVPSRDVIFTLKQLIAAQTQKALV